MHNEIFIPEVSEDENDTTKTPFDNFKMLWSDKLTYSTRNSEFSVNTSRSEIEQYIGVHIKMGLITDRFDLTSICGLAIATKISR